MDLKIITDQFLNWEEEYKLYDIKVNNYPIYSFIRTEIFESLIFESDLKNVLIKTSSVTKERINYLKIIQNSFSFFRNHRCIKGNHLVITNTENKIKLNSNYADNFFDKIVNQASNSISILEFPNLKDYHFDNILNQKKTVKADLFYVLEKIFKARINKNEINEAVARISSLYSQLYKEIHGTKHSTKIEFGLTNRIRRNLQRIRIYEKFVKYYKPNRIFLKSAYSPLKQIIIYVAKKQNIKVIELQHGHIYPFHIGYLLPLNKTSNSLFPDEILVWSEYYKEMLINNDWKDSEIKVVGDFTYNQQLVQKDNLENGDVKKLVTKYNKVITLVSQHTLDTEFVKYLNNINKLPDDTIVFVKLHPKYVASQENNFKSIVENNKNVILVKEGNIKDYLGISDLVVGVYSTGIIEALEMNKSVHLIDTTMSQFFNDLIEKKIVRKSESILSSYKLITNYDNQVEIKFRTKFQGYPI